MGLFRHQRQQMQAEAVPIPLKPTERLQSLDVLRGLDILFLIGIQPFLLKLLPLIRGWDLPGIDFVQGQLTHCSWVGFTTWDLVMPLFIFMSGITLPFSLAKHQGQGWKQGHLWLRLMRRVVILWILGGIVQGNFLSLNWDQIHLYTNTLQAIAVGTLIAWPAVLLLSVRWQVGLIAMLIFGYWMVFVIFGGDSYAQGHNIAETIDRAVLGRFRDGASLSPEGIVRFSASYHYAWVLPSLNFGAQMLLGAQAGNLLRSGLPAVTKIRMMSLCGFGLVMFGWTFHLFHPVIKPIYSGSMVMVSCGYAFLLMMFFYWLVDLRKVRRPFAWVQVIGCNALLAYVLHEYVSFDSVVNSLFFGLRQYMGEAYVLIPPLAVFGLIYGILWLLKECKLYLRA